MGKDYLASRQLEAQDKLDHGIKGMKWGVRRSTAQLAGAAKGGAATSSTSKSSSTPAKPKANESSPERYARLKAEAKAGRAEHLSDDDLKFLNARTEALAKIEKLNAQNKNWLADASKQALRNTAKNSMNAIAGAAVAHYISKPLIASITK